MAPISSLISPTPSTLKTVRSPTRRASAMSEPAFLREQLAFTDYLRALYSCSHSTRGAPGTRWNRSTRRSSRPKGSEPRPAMVLVGAKADLCEGPAVGIPPLSLLTSLKVSLPSISCDPYLLSSSGDRVGAGQHPNLRQVPTAEAHEWAKEKGMPYFESSAKNGVNVEVL